MDHVIFQQFLSGLSPQLALMHDLSHKHQSPCQHVKLVRVAHSNVRTLEEVYKSYLKSRRVWVGITYPSSPHRMFDAEAHETLQVWSRLLVFTPFSLSMSPAVHVEVTATADAMASQTLAGLGGAAFFPNGKAVRFHFQITLDRAGAIWKCVGDDMQKHIAALELLAQFALTYCIVSCLPRCRGPVSCHQGTDNSAADAASAKAYIAAKGLSMTPGMAMALSPFFTFMRRFQIFPRVTQIPGYLNVTADSLSWFKI